MLGLHLKPHAYDFDTKNVGVQKPHTLQVHCIAKYHHTLFLVPNTRIDKITIVDRNKGGKFLVGT